MDNVLKVTLLAQHHRSPLVEFESVCESARRNVRVCSKLLDDVTSDLVEHLHPIL